MGLGLFRNGRYQPITPWEGSWARVQELARAGIDWQPSEPRTPAPAPVSPPNPLLRPQPITLPGVFDVAGNRIK